MRRRRRGPTSRISIYNEATGRGDARRPGAIATDVPFATALRRNDVEALQTRVADLLSSAAASSGSSIVRNGNRALVDVGNAAANLPASLALVADGKKRFGELEVSDITPGEFAARVKRQTGLEVLRHARGRRRPGQHASRGREGEHPGAATVLRRRSATSATGPTRSRGPDSSASG